MTITEMIYELAKISLDKTIPAICTVLAVSLPVHAKVMKGKKRKRPRR